MDETPVIEVEEVQDEFAPGKPIESVVTTIPALPVKPKMGRPPNAAPSLYHQDDEYFDKVEAEGDGARQVRDLHGEIKLLRATTLEMLKNFREKPTASDDASKVMAICRLTKTISTLSKVDFELAKEGFISKGSLKIWLSNLAREIKLEFLLKADQDRFAKVAQKVGEPVGSE